MNKILKSQLDPDKIIVVYKYTWQIIIYLYYYTVCDRINRRMLHFQKKKLINY